jgi:hypothetical protein
MKGGVYECPDGTGAEEPGLVVDASMKGDTYERRDVRCPGARDLGRLASMMGGVISVAIGPSTPTQGTSNSGLNEGPPHERHDESGRVHQGGGGLALMKGGTHERRDLALFNGFSAWDMVPR